MDDKLNPKEHPRVKYDKVKNLINENIDSPFGYCSLNGEEQIAKELCNDKRPLLRYVAATTASNLQLSIYKCEGFTAAEGEPSIVVREIIIDNTGHKKTKPHWNNKFYVLIPSVKGIVLNFPLEKDKFGRHFVDLVDNEQINETIKSLPPNKFGSISEFYANPKAPYVKIEPIEGGR